MFDKVLKYASKFNQFEYQRYKKTYKKEQENFKTVERKCC